MPPCSTNLKKCYEQLQSICYLDLLQNNENEGKEGRKETGPGLTTSEGDGR